MKKGVATLVVLLAMTAGNAFAATIDCDEGWSVVDRLMVVLFAALFAALYILPGLALARR